MAGLNDNYLKLPGSYLFSDIAKKVKEYSSNNPDKSIIKLGIGDVTRPLTPTIIKALHDAVDEMAVASSFKGYGPEQGYDFLRNAIVENDYIKRGINISIDEVFVSDGSKSDTGNIGDIFGNDNVVAICDPVYPVYADTNAMAGRAGNFISDQGKWDRLIYMPCTVANNFVPQLPEKRPDLIYLCFPNNPTGATITRVELKKWVDYARENDSIILYDAAYEAYIKDDLPHSIYEIEGADECAIEFRSFSKNAGFTGTRCAFTVVPHKVMGRSTDGTRCSLNKLWNRRQTTKFNGVPYIIQKAAEAVYTAEGHKEIIQLVDYYLYNAKMIRQGLQKIGFQVYGGENAPYVWMKTPNNLTSWQFFDLLLNKISVVGTPGSGFGPSGEGYFRLTGFGSKENTIQAIERIQGAF